MWLNKAGSLAERGINRSSRILGAAAAGLLWAMVLVTVADVGLRYFVKKPIIGAFELTQIMMACLVLWGLAYTQIKGGHVSIDLVVKRFPERAQRVISSITYLASAGLFLLISWQSVLMAKSDWLKHHVTIELGLPTFPFIIVAALGSVLFFLVFFVEFVKSVGGGGKK